MRGMYKQIFSFILYLQRFEVTNFLETDLNYILTQIELKNEKLQKKKNNCILLGNKKI